MSSYDKAFEIESGLLVENGPFYTGGAASPVGLDLPTGTFYTQITANGVLIWRKYNTGVNDWRQLSAQDIPFVDPGATYRAGATEVQTALDELRERTVLKYQSIVSSLNGTEVLDDSDNSFLVVSGTATGFTVKLPDATTLPKGRVYKIVNISNQSIDIDNNADSKLITSNEQDITELTLQDNSTAAGYWIIQATSGTATGIVSQVLTSNVTFTTTSTTDVLITGFSITPVDGRYALFFSAEIEIVQQNRIAEVVAYIDGSSIENTRRKAQGIGNNFDTGVNTVGEVNVNGSQAVDIRVNITSNQLNILQRSLVLIRLGASV